MNKTSKIWTIITISLTSYFAKRNQLRFEQQKLKESYYTNYLESYSNNLNFESDETIKSLCHAHNNLFLIANNDVINKLQDLDELTISKGIISKEKYNLIIGTDEFMKEYNNRFRDFIIAMRNDLYGKSTNNDIPIIFSKAYKK